MDKINSLIKQFGIIKFTSLTTLMCLMIFFLTFVFSKLSSEKMEILYNNLGAQNTNEILAQLALSGIPYKVGQDGKSIYIPSEKITETRMKIAQIGLSGEIKGYELFDDLNTITSSSLSQRINKIRALEGELSRTIMVLNGIKSARVHLAIPEQKIFEDIQSTPHASVIVTMMGKSKLSTTQITGMRHLVAGAVAGMKIENVAIIDQDGQLLSIPSDSTETSSALLKLQLEVETEISNNLIALLSKSIGTDNIKISVHANLNEKRVILNQDIYDPDGQVLRSSSINNNTQNELQGQPSSNDKNQDQITSSELSKRNDSKKTEENRNFEISKTTKQIIEEPGGILGISVAVLVNGTYTGTGKEKKYVPRSEADLQQIKKIVETAIGLNSNNRQDRVEVVNMPFEEPAPYTEESLKNKIIGSIPIGDIQKIIQVLILGFLGLIIFFLVMKPALKYITAERDKNDESIQEIFKNQEFSISGTAEALERLNNQSANIRNRSMNQEEYESEEKMQNVEAKMQKMSNNKIRQIVNKYPEESANIIRSWLYE